MLIFFFNFILSLFNFNIFTLFFLFGCVNPQCIIMSTTNFHLVVIVHAISCSYTDSLNRVQDDEHLNQGHLNIPLLMCRKNSLVMFDSRTRVSNLKEIAPWWQG